MTAAKRHRVELLACDPDNVFKTLDLSEARRLGEVERCILNAGGTDHVIGIDEAGRGPLAGPVIAAAVYLPLSFTLPEGLDDSKKLGHATRESLFEILCATLPAWAIAGATNTEIDAHNIRQATIMAMSRAFEALRRQMPVAAVVPALIDGDLTLPIAAPQVALVKGDGRSLAIAAASVLAKVYRDRIMESLDAVHPGYGLARHKGYPTGSHRLAVLERGHSPVHRRSFAVRAPKPKP